jgi:hypothetical protein
MATIKAIQTGTVTLNDAATATATITAVDLSKSILYFNAYLNTINPNQGLIRGSISSTTQLLFQAGNSYDAAEYCYIRYWVVEFSSGVTVQRGLVNNIYDVAQSVTIDPVTTSKTFVLNYFKSVRTSITDRQWVVSDLTSTTNVDFYNGFGGPAEATDDAYQVVEYDTATVQKVGPVSKAGGDPPYDDSITASTMANTFLTNGSFWDSTGGGIDDALYHYMTSTTNIRTADEGTTDKSSTLLYYVITTADVKVQRGQPEMTTAETTDTSTITAVDTSYSVAQLTNWDHQVSSSSTTGDSYDEANVRLTFNSSTELGAQRYSAGGVTALWSFEVLEWTAAVLATPRTRIMWIHPFG